MKTQSTAIAVLAVLGLFVLLAAPPAHATATLYLNDGIGHTITVADGSAKDTCLSADCVTFNGVLGDWNINVTTGSDLDASSPFIMDLNSVNHHLSSSKASVLTIEFSDNGFVTPFPQFEGDIGGTIARGGTVTAALIGGDTNTMFSGSAIGPTLTFSYPPTAFGGTFVGANKGYPTSPYSLTEVITITFGKAAGGASFDYSVTPIPEPASLALLGGGLLLAGIVVRRKARRG